jgi:hypothetical protein
MLLSEESAREMGQCGQKLIQAVKRCDQQNALYQKKVRVKWDSMVRN